MDLGCTVSNETEGQSFGLWDTFLDKCKELLIDITALVLDKVCCPKERLEMTVHNHKVDGSVTSSIHTEGAIYENEVTIPLQ